MIEGLFSLHPAKLCCLIVDIYAVFRTPPENEITFLLRAGVCPADNFTE